MGHSHCIIGCHSRFVECGFQDGTSQVFPAAQRSGQDFVRSFEDRVIKLIFAIVWTTPAIHLRRGQLQQPAKVFGSDEVPRRSQQMRANDVAGVERFFNGRMRRTVHSQSHCPLGRMEILRLHCAEPTHDISGFLEL
jgi:hypothetical protein